MPLWRQRSVEALQVRIELPLQSTGGPDRLIGYPPSVIAAVAERLGRRLVS
jgi:hypothetical protein